MSMGMVGCKQNETQKAEKIETDSLEAYVDERIKIYEKVKLSTNLNSLSPNERKMLPLLIEAATIMDELFWKQEYPQRDSLLNTIKH